MMIDDGPALRIRIQRCNAAALEAKARAEALAAAASASRWRRFWLGIARAYWSARQRAAETKALKAKHRLMAMVI